MTRPFECSLCHGLHATERGAAGCCGAEAVTPADVLARERQAARDRLADAAGSALCSTLFELGGRAESSVHLRNMVGKPCCHSCDTFASGVTDAFLGVLRVELRAAREGAP